MRVISFNANGLRAAARKGFFDWLKRQKADVVCLQETKAHMNSLDGEIFRPKGFHCYFFDAHKKGYSGVGLYCREKPDKVTTGLGWSHADEEGRYIQADFGKLSVASIYLPSGSSGEHRQGVKWDFLDHYMKKLKKVASSKRSFIICGDWNIVHQEIDIKNFKSNQKTSGCLPEERQWIDDVFNKVGLVDAFRVKNHKPDQYTWWSLRTRARDRNVGWRIDYQIITPDLKNKVEAVKIYSKQVFSDHAPLIVDYKLHL